METGLIEKILLTGANGGTGRETLLALAARGAQVRVFIRNADQAEALAKLGADEHAIGDLLNADSIAAAMQGCTKVVHICPPMHPDETAIGHQIIDIAKAQNISHFIEYSVLHPMMKEVRHHRAKLEVEEHLISSGVPFTILQPCRYMQHLQKVWQKVKESGVMAVPYSIDSGLSVADLKDIAQAVATVATTDGHLGATYELAGPQALSERDMAAIMSDVLQRAVNAQEIAVSDWAVHAEKIGLPRYRIETMTRMFHHYSASGLVGNGNILGWLLGRPPTTFKQFVERIAEAQCGMTP